MDQAFIDNHIERVLAVEKPAQDARDPVWELVKRYFTPELIGLENASPDKPTLFVGNHTLFALDAAVMHPALYKATGVYTRLLADKMIRFTRYPQMLLKRGVVLADRQVCSALMKSGEHIVVFPGGAREAMTKRGQQYVLDWQDRTGFVRMAIEHGYSITPFCGVGPDDIYDLVVDSDEMLNHRYSPLGPLLRMTGMEDKIRKDFVPPIPRGLMYGALPRPERFYYAFGKPISMKRYAGKEEDLATRKRVQQRVAKAIEGLIDTTIELRDNERQDMGWMRKRLTRF